MTGFCVVGVDPGFRQSGVIARRGNEVLDHGVISREGEGPPDGPYVGRVLQAVSDARRRFAGSGGDRPDVLVAVEGVIKPNPHMGLTDVTGLLGAAVVLGGVLAIWPDAVVVRPRRHGRGGQLAYPAELWGEREGPEGQGWRRHCRSAWDVSLAAEQIVRQRQAVAS